AATRFDAIEATADRRAAPRPRPEPAPLDTPAPPGTSSAADDRYLKLVGHRIEEVQPGVMGVHVWIEWQGRTFSGAAVGSWSAAGAPRTPALATLRALHACLQVLYRGPGQPGLVLETVVRIMVGRTPVVVAALTAAEKARPRLLTAAWPDQGEPGLPAIMATLHATPRTVVRWLTEAQDPAIRPPVAVPGMERILIGTPERRLILADVAVEHRPAGEVEVGVRLTGFGGTVDRKRHGPADEAAQLELGAE